HLQRHRPKSRTVRYPERKRVQPGADVQVSVLGSFRRPERSEGVGLGIRDQPLRRAQGDDPLRHLRSLFGFVDWPAVCASARAVTIDLIPPRILKSPTTSIHFGLAAACRSSRIRFTAAKPKWMEVVGDFNIRGG